MNSFSSDLIYVFTGAFKSYLGKYTKTTDVTDLSTLYLGYALTYGKFHNANLGAGMPNWYVPKKYGYFGQVFVYSNNNQRHTIGYGLSLGSSSCDVGLVTNLNDLIEKDQTGTKFGAVLEAADITGDGYDELFIGAPLYTGERPDEGRVFVYTTTETSVCGPIGVLSGGARVDSLKERAGFARFGSSIASLGDINKDKYTDVAIGAPYEDDGSGAVYIYHGIGDCKCVMEDKFAQRIAGSAVQPGIKSFGWSIYGNEDVDDNSYPDFAVGAYKSDTIAVFRTRPIVRLHVEMTIAPKPIPLDGSKLSCSKDRRSLCFNMTVLFQFETLSERDDKVSEISFKWILKADTVYKGIEGHSRIQFRPNAQDSFVDIINVSKNQPVNQQYILDVKGHNGKPEPRDAWTNVRMEGTFELIPKHDGEFEALDALLPEDEPRVISETVEFDKQCESIDLCTSDLNISVDMFLLRNRISPIKVESDTVIYVDKANELEVTVDMTNLVNSSYRARLSGNVNSLMRRDADPNNGIIGATCKHSSPLGKTMTYTNCTADSKLDRNEDIKVKFYFDITRVQLIPELNMDKMMKSIKVNFTAFQENHDVNLTNNVYYKEIPIALKYDVQIVEDNDVSVQEKYTSNVESTRRLRVTHRYFITNDGPSFLPMTYVNITIPTKLGDSALGFIVRDSLPGDCYVVGDAAIVRTTTAAPSTTEGFTIPDHEVERRRRRDVPDAEEKPATGASQSAASTMMNISCNAGEDGCEVIECKITKLERHQQHVVEVDIDIYEKAIAQQKDIRMIRYVTNATVTDPYVWYGSKVVPWKSTVFAKKTTVFIVETGSVVKEVNIWIIIGAVLGALALLVIVIIILYLCGFFKRKQHSKVQEWKKESLYNRRSARMSMNMSPTRGAYENIEDEQ